jgi:phosphoribosylamine--glycine ligase
MTHILVIGGGGREHALAWKLAQSPRATRISVAPGNGGMAMIPTAASVDIDATDIVSLIDYVDTEAVDLTVVGPEEPLAGGLVDQFEAAGLRIFGPQRSAAMIETSKSHAKHLMQRYGVPTAPFVEFTELLPAMEYVVTHLVDELVIKADGLAQGKGVFLPRGEDDAEGILRALLERDALGPAGHRVIIEHRMQGPEVSVMAFCDGETLAPMPGVCDHKRLRDEDRGPNTGGMGAIAPSPALTPDLARRVEREILLPVLHGLAADGMTFRGVLYAGVILAEQGPLALEMNVRFGDPGAQVVLPLLESDLLDVIDACLDGTLDPAALRWRDETAVSVVMVTEGYPTRRDPGLPVRAALALANWSRPAGAWST